MTRNIRPLAKGGLKNACSKTIFVGSFVFAWSEAVTAFGLTSSSAGVPKLVPLLDLLANMDPTLVQSPALIAASRCRTPLLKRR